jgi:membrane protease YdiL (CAAX protease family)
MRSRVRVVRETCETAGDMEGKLTADPVAESPEAGPSRFPRANWGAGTAIVGILLSLAVGVALAFPAAVLGQKPHSNDLTTLGNVGVQLATALGFLLVPIVIATQNGAGNVSEAFGRLGVRPFRPSALKWMAAAFAAYFLFTAIYTVLITPPDQKNIAEDFGAWPLQVLLIVVAAPISEEICFRGMLFGGLRRSLPRIPAALVAGLVFGTLHATTGVAAVPPLIVFGLVLCLLYEGTGSIVPGIMLHAVNNALVLLSK